MISTCVAPLNVLQDEMLFLYGKVLIIQIDNALHSILFDIRRLKTVLSLLSRRSAREQAVLATEESALAVLIDIACVWADNGRALLLHY